MSLFNVGRLCVKLAGRDAGRKCVVVEQVDKTFVVVDGNVRRKKVNMRHLEPLTEMVEIKDKASHADVSSAFNKLGLDVWERKSKQVAERPKKQKVKKVKAVKIAPKKESKKEEPKAVEVEKKVEDKPVEETKEELKQEVKTEAKESTETKEAEEKLSHLIRDVPSETKE
jgi:large subunit ribosomal protein L14e